MLWHTLLPINPYINKYCMYWVGLLVHGTHPINHKDPLQPPACTSNLNSNLRAVSSSSFKATKQKRVSCVSCSRYTKDEKESQKSCSGRKNTNTAFPWPSLVNTEDAILTYVNAIIYSWGSIKGFYKRHKLHLPPAYDLLIHHER